MGEDNIEEGLAGVYMGESGIGRVDGENGVLYYAGYNLDELIGDASYEEVVSLLHHQELPDEKQLDHVTSVLHGQRTLPEPIYDVIMEMADAAPMDVLRTCISYLSAFDDAPDDHDAFEAKALRLIAKVPTIIAAHYRIRKGKTIIEPHDDLSHAANFLYMLHGEEPSEEESAAMNDALILYAEHGMNASTFSGVVTVSTLANLYSAVTSAIGALQGPLHGGATETVMQMLDDVGTADDAEDWVQEQIDNHEKIPGFGHRVYQVTDPRCTHFKNHIQTLMRDTDKQRLDTIEAVRMAVEERLGEKGIWPNADLYSGTLYHRLGIPPAYYTAMFAMARVAGWTAHVKEQLDHNRIIRPRVKYTGDLDKMYIPVDER